MLPNITLQLGELTSFDSNANDLGVVPEGADSLEANFADVLRGSTSVEIMGELPSGTVLPSDGNDLPLLEISTQLSPESTSNELTPDVLSPPSIDALLPRPPDANAGLDVVRDVLAPLESDLDLTSIAAGDATLIEPELEPVPPLVGERFSNTSAVQDGNDLQANVPVLPAVDIPKLDATPPAPASALPGNAAELVRDTALSRLNIEKRRDITLDRVSDRGAPIPQALVQNRDVDIAAKTSLRPTEFVVPNSVASEAVVKASTDELQLPGKPVVTNAVQTTSPSIDLGAIAPTSSRFVVEAPGPLVSRSLTETIHLPVQEAGWDRAISERVLLMANGKLQNAEIRLTPAELGPLRVQVVVEDGAANVSFQAQHALTREAIEQAMPRLRELLAEQGLSLGQTQVSDEGSRQGLRDDPGEAHSSEAAVEHTDVDDEQEMAPSHASELGLLDTFV